MEHLAVSLTPLLGTFLGALLAAWLFFWNMQRLQRLQVKRDVLQRLSRDRDLILAHVPDTSRDAYAALKEARDAFFDCPEVIAALNKLHEQWHDPTRLPNNLVTLIKAMSEAAGAKYVGLNDDFILKPFGPPVPLGDNGLHPSNQTSGRGAKPPDLGKQWTGPNN